MRRLFPVFILIFSILPCLAPIKDNGMTTNNPPQFQSILPTINTPMKLVGHVDGSGTILETSFGAWTGSNIVCSVWTNNLNGDIFINGDGSSPLLYDINTNGASGHHMLSSVALAELEGDLGSTNGYQLYINNVAPTLQYVYGPQFVTLIDPSQDDGDAPYVFDTPTNVAVTGSVLSDFRSNGVSKASISFAGIETANGYIDNSGSAGSIVAYGAGNRLVATNVATLVSNVTLTTINATDIHVTGKATFNQIIITNGFFSATNVWSGATNSVDMSINDQYFTTVTPCQISGIFNTSNSLSSQITLTILNNSSTNITVTYGSAGFVDRDHVTAQTITNATVGIFWIKHTPAIGGHTNVVFNDF